MKVIAFIEDLKVINNSFNHLKFVTEKKGKIGKNKKIIGKKYNFE